MGPTRIKRLAKPVAFVAVIFLLLLLTRFTVAYDPLPKGAAPLPSDLRGEVVVTAIDGGVQTVTDPSTAGDSAPELVGVDTWQPSSNTIVVSPQVSSSGCESQYETTMGVTFSTANQLPYAVKGSVNVTVFDDRNGLKLATDILTLDFKPGQTASGVANFDIMGTDPNPIYLITVTFPTAADLSTGIPQQRVSLLEYILYRTGVLAP